MKELIQRHQNAIDNNDKMNFLHFHQDAMTDGEHQRYWDNVSKLIEAEVALERLYEVVKKRVEQCDT